MQMFKGELLGWIGVEAVAVNDLLISLVEIHVGIRGMVNTLNDPIIFAFMSTPEI